MTSTAAVMGRSVRASPLSKGLRWVGTHCLVAVRLRRVTRAWAGSVGDVVLGVNAFAVAVAVVRGSAGMGRLGRPALDELQPVSEEGTVEVRLCDAVTRAIAVQTAWMDGLPVAAVTRRWWLVDLTVTALVATIPT